MRENKFTLFVTIILAILTILLAWNYYKDYQKIKKEEKEKAIFEKKIKKENITKLVIYNVYKTELIKNGNFWFVYSLDDIADSYLIDNIISNIYQPGVNEIFQYDENYYKEFFKNPVNVYFLYGNKFYHLQRGIKNDFTNETYLWIDLPEFKDKIYIVNYWDFNYLDKSPEEFRMKKLLNIDQSKVDKIIVNNILIYKEEQSKKRKNKELKNEEEKKYLWKTVDNKLVSKEYINSLFAFLNNYDFKKVLYSIKNMNKLRLVAKIAIYSNNDHFSISILEYNKEEYIVKCSYRKPLFIYSKQEADEFLKKEIYEKKIFSYYIEDFDNFDKLYISDSRGRFSFIKKSGKWFSPKNEEKTSYVNMLFNTLKNLEYKEVYLANPLNARYELYTIELVGHEKQKIYLYNPDYLSYQGKIYKIDPFVFIIKELIR